MTFTRISVIRSLSQFRTVKSRTGLQELKPIIEGPEGRRRVKTWRVLHRYNRKR